MRDSLSTTRVLAAAVDTEFAVVRAALLALATVAGSLLLALFLSRRYLRPNDA